jgi:phosphoglucomutase
VGSLVSVSEIVHSHWASYGRNFYTRHDYEEVSAEQGKELVEGLQAMASGAVEVPSAEPLAPGAPRLVSVDEFSYTDPVDGSVSTNQGIRCLFEGGARAVFRLSGTGSVGATIRLYVEKYVPPPEGSPPPKPADPDAPPTVRTAAPELLVPTQEALGSLVQAALKLSRLREITGRDEPSVIT